MMVADRYEADLKITKWNEMLIEYDIIQNIEITMLAILL